MATLKVETVSSDIIKPTIATPSHLKTYRMCLQDQLALPYYMPVVLFYSASDVVNGLLSPVSSVMEKLKASMSGALSSFYPFPGRIKENTFFECNDQGALFVVARASMPLSEVLADPDFLGLLEQFQPFPLYKQTSEEEVTLAVKVSFFECGGLGIGVCLSHKIADGGSLARFMVAWSQAALGLGEDVRTKPCLDASAFFPPKDNVNFSISAGPINAEKLVTKRFCFSGKSMAQLKAAIVESTGGGLKPTRVEAMTALIWRSALEAATKARRLNGFSGTTFPPSAAVHAVDIRSRASPPMPQQTLGNLLQCVVASRVEVGEDNSSQLHGLIAVLRESFASVNGDFISELQGDNGLAKATQPFIRASQLASTGSQVYRFTSWARFPFYEADFGWGKPLWVFTASPSVKNFIILMGMGSEDELGIEAWVTLTEADMIEFQANEELLKYVLPPSH